MLTLFMALVMFLLLRALRTRQPLDFVWTGIAFGLGFTAYLPIRFVLPAVVGVYLLFRVVGNRSFLRQHAHGLLMLALAFMLAFMPLGIYFYRFPDLLLARAQQASVQQDIERAGGSLQPLKDNITKAFGMFNYSGDPRARHNLPLAPMLDPITGIFFVLGLGYVILRWRRPENAILPAWLILGMVPGVMSLADSNPHSMRTIANLPAVCLLAALAAERAWTYVSENYGRRAVQRLLPVAAAIAVLALGANVVLYFNRQANDRSVYYDYDPVQTEVARQVLALGKTNQVFVAAAYTNHSAVKLLGAGAPYLTFNQTQHLPVRDAGDKDLTFILEPVHRQLQALFGQYYPAARFAEWKDRYGNLGFITVTVPRAAAAAAQGAIASYYRGTQPVGSAAVERAEESVSANWVNAPLDPPFAVSWRSALYVARYGPHTIILESSEPATVTLDNQVILTASNGVQSTALTLYGGFHALDVTAVVTKRDGLLNLRWKTPDGAEQAIPRSSLYSVDVAANGLLGKYYRGNAWAGAPAIQQKDLFIFPNDLLPAPFSIEWEGMIYAPQDGQYVFGSQSDDGSLVYIDGKLVVDNGGHHSDRYVEARVTLTQGLHDLRIRYFQDDGGRVMELYWIPPGGRKELVPNAALFPPNTVLTGPVVIPTQAPLPTAAPIQTPIAGRTPDARPPIPVVSSIGQIEPQMIIGREGSGPGEFRNPRGVAVDRDGNIYVADTGNKRVQKFDAQGNFIAEWKTAKDALVEPVGIAIGANGDVYVLEPERDGAHIFSANGEYRGKVGDGLGLYRPRGLSVDTSGVLYFANTGGNNVVRASANAQMLGTIGKTGKKTGELEQPTDVAVDLAGNIYVADTYNQRIQRFTPDGRFATQWAIPAAGTALGPHIAIAADGVLYVTDPDNHQVSAYSPDGAILATWGGQGNAEGQLVQPVGIFVDSSGLIYVADSGNHRIQVWGRR
jgi:sugar lactone lactonase YvrE